MTEEPATRVGRMRGIDPDSPDIAAAILLAAIAAFIAWALWMAYT